MSHFLTIEGCAPSQSDYHIPAKQTCGNLQLTVVNVGTTSAPGQVAYREVLCW
jgi:hypothetical protein